MKIKESIAFSSNLIIQIQKLLEAKGFLLFQDYVPKEYNSSDSEKTHFWLAILNVCGLINDCCTFFTKQAPTGKSFQMIMVTSGILCGNDFEEVSSVVKNLTVFRNFYCHIFPSYQNEDTIYKLNSFFAGCGISITGKDNSNSIVLTDNEWKRACEFLVAPIESFFNELLNALSKADDVIWQKMLNQKKDWDEILVYWYQTEDFFNPRIRYALMQYAILYKKCSDAQAQAHFVNRTMRSKKETLKSLIRSMILEEKITRPTELFMKLVENELE